LDPDEKTRHGPTLGEALPMLPVEIDIRVIAMRGGEISAYPSYELVISVVRSQMTNMVEFDGINISLVLPPEIYSQYQTLEFNSR
jgi:hypothetical protein